MKLIVTLILALSFNVVEAADTVPTEVQMPGTQPGEITNQLTPGFPVATRHSLDPSKQCTFCHANYNTTVEAGHNWGGSMMSQAARDPVFWATVATAEQDFNGSGDFCLRCHTSGGWLAGRSTPTDGSAMTAKDSNGVECDTCHRLTNPDGSELKGVQNPPFIANNGATPAIGHFGSAQYVMWGATDKLGPYADSVTRHPSLQSNYHRSPELCGTCHDVSNPVTGVLPRVEVLIITTTSNWHRRKARKPPASTCSISRPVGNTFSSCICPTSAPMHSSRTRAPICSMPG